MLTNVLDELYRSPPIHGYHALLILSGDLWLYVQLKNQSFDIHQW